MKITDTNQSSDNEGDLSTEYTFDYTKAKPNRFATSSSNSTMIVLDEDVARVFPTSESVNKALRQLI